MEAGVAVATSATGTVSPFFSALKGFCKELEGDVTELREQIKLPPPVASSVQGDPEQADILNGCVQDMIMEVTDMDDAVSAMIKDCQPSLDETMEACTRLFLQAQSQIETLEEALIQYGYTAESTESAVAPATPSAIDTTTVPDSAVKPLAGTATPSATPGTPQTPELAGISSSAMNMIHGTDLPATPTAVSATPAQIRADAEQKSRMEAEAKAREDMEARARAEAEAKVRAEMEARAKAEAEAKVRAEMEAKAKAEAEAKVRAEMEAKAKAEAEVKVRVEMEAKAKAEAVEKARIDEEARVRREYEEAARKELEKKAREEEEKKKAAAAAAAVPDTTKLDLSKYPQIPAVSKAEFDEKVVSYLRSQVPLDFLNDNINKLNRTMAESCAQTPGNPPSVVVVGQEQIKQILGLDAKAKAVILTLIKLKRLAAQGRNDAGEQCYRFPVKTML